MTLAGERLRASGEHELRLGEQVAVAVEAGGGIRRYAVGGWDVLDGYPAGTVVDGARGQLLAPWPNRISDGAYRWDGESLQLPLTEPEAGNAIHGLVRWSPFGIRDRAASRAVLGSTIWPQPGYPFHLDVQVSYELTASGLVVVVRARNLGERAAPYAVGQHPYVTFDTGPVDNLLLEVPAERWLATDDRGTPVAEHAVVDTPYDFRRPRPIGALALDTAFCGLNRDDSGAAVARLTDVASHRTVDVWVQGPADCLQVYTGDTLPEHDRRRRAVALEPMSAPPNAFRTHPAAVALQPGATHELRWGISAHAD